MQGYLNIALSALKAIRTSIQGDYKAGLGHRELQVLEHVTPEHSHGKRVFMENGITLKYLGSRYTLRKSIQKLIDLDYLNIDTTDDSRQRLLMPTARALALFDTNSKSISHTLVA